MLISLWIVVCYLDEADAVLTGFEEACFSTNAAALGISLLDVWAGISAFPDGFASQAHVPVLENAWIENASAAVSLLTACYGIAKSCTDRYNYS